MRILKTIYSLFIVLLLSSSFVYALEVYRINSAPDYYSIEQLRQLTMEDFQTKRHKDERDLIENWQGINLQKWLISQDYTDFQSLRFESEDNYMIRIHKAELDSMQGYIALKKDNNFIDSTEVRIIFPGQRDMYWIRNIDKIYLEDFKPVPAPNQIYIWDSVSSKLIYRNDLTPFVNISGYYIDDIMKGIFHSDEGSVILVSRDGLKSRLEYPKHLKGAVLEVTKDGALNLKSPAIPAGMWLKDIVYLQCGPYAVIRYDFLYHLNTLYKTLDWKSLAFDGKIIKANVQKEILPLENLYSPDAKPFEANEWIELK